jgi:prevent-host-death family protein
MATTIPAGEFKAKCLKLMDKVAKDGQPLIVTKHGKPVVQVTPIPAPENIVGSMKGSVLWMGDIISPIDVEWDALK